MAEAHRNSPSTSSGNYQDNDLLLGEANTDSGSSCLTDVNVTAITSVTERCEEQPLRVNSSGYLDVQPDQTVGISSQTDCDGEHEVGYPASAFHIFADTYRTSISSVNPALMAKDIEKSLLRIWNQMLEEEKKPFVELFTKQSATQMKSVTDGTGRIKRKRKPRAEDPNAKRFTNSIIVSNSAGRKVQGAGLRQNSRPISSLYQSISAIEVRDKQHRPTIKIPCKSCGTINSIALLPYMQNQAQQVKPTPTRSKHNVTFHPNTSAFYASTILTDKTNLSGRATVAVRPNMFNMSQLKATRGRPPYYHILRSRCATLVTSNYRGAAPPAPSYTVSSRPPTTLVYSRGLEDCIPSTSVSGGGRFRFHPQQESHELQNHLDAVDNGNVDATDAGEDLRADGSDHSNSSIGHMVENALYNAPRLAALSPAGRRRYDAYSADDENQQDGTAAGDLNLSSIVDQHFEGSDPRSPDDLVETMTEYERCFLPNQPAALPAAMDNTQAGAEMLYDNWSYPFNAATSNDSFYPMGSSLRLSSMSNPYMVSSRVPYQMDYHGMMYPYYYQSAMMYQGLWGQPSYYPPGMYGNLPLPSSMYSYPFGQNTLSHLTSGAGLQGTRSGYGLQGTRSGYGGHGRPPSANVPQQQQPTDPAASTQQ